MKHKLLFIQATQYGHNSKILCKQNPLMFPDLAFPLLAAMTPDNWEVDIKLEVIEDIDFDADVDLVGIGAMGPAIFRAIEIADKFRERGKTVFFGGHMVSMAPSLVKSHTDSIVIGDAEIAYPKLLKDWEEKGRLHGIYDYPVNSLEGLPVPKYEDLAEKEIGPLLPVNSGRGCPNSCTFCSIACLYKGKYLTRPVDEVVRDILKIKSMGYKGFFLIDDNIFGNPEYLEELCKRIKPLKMFWMSQCSLELAKNPRLLKLVVESGCKILNFGIETVSQEGINKLGKKWLQVHEYETHLKTIKEAGLVLSVTMMLGTDGDTEQSIKTTYDFIKRAKIQIVRIGILTPFPGTPLYKQLKKQGRLLHEYHKKYNGITCVHLPEKISSDKLDEMYTWINQKMYTIPSIIYRVLLNKSTFKNPRLTFFTLLVNSKYRNSMKRGDMITP